MKTNSHYVFAADSRVFSREGFTGIAYSDGAATEERMLRQVKSCKDVSDASPELGAMIVDWPSEYHFSPLRANLLRPFSFKGLNVLELGCGCGALTRVLGEKGAKVSAVEGSFKRAAIAAERCRDLPDVRVYCDNFSDFNSKEKFDAVTLVGVLEYSRRFISDSDPIQRCLELARSHLTPEGELYLAIENQLGLKYWNALAEDHMGIPFFGIQDRYSANSAVTFGRKELTERLLAAGFEDVEFFFLFPDYKLPELILSEGAIADPQLRVGDLLCRVSSRDYGRRPMPCFHESRAWQVVARNGLAGDMANSFLVRARNKAGSPRVDWVARTYSANRLRELATENVIFRKEGRLQVAKNRLFDLPVKPCRFKQHTGIANYAEGELHIVELQRITLDGGGFAEISAWARPWLDMLRAHADNQGRLPGDFADCIPTNLVRDAAGKLHYIDAEWRADTEIPLAWVAVRGLVMAISVSPPPHAIGKISYRQFVATVLEREGVVLTAPIWKEVVEWEDALRNCCYGAHLGTGSFEGHLARTGLPWTTYATILESLQGANDLVQRISAFGSNVLRRLQRLAGARLPEIYDLWRRRKLFH
jgi:SAM-dependent methyltransferase